ncbi:MAG: hypothetical protein LC721_04450, partial [Actinobacteria bacterium]|nr:hypothetical protein [Actinomycetota bacterium]
PPAWLSWFGVVGVEIFFVISGFLIGGLLLSITDAGRPSTDQGRHRADGPKVLRLYLFHIPIFGYLLQIRFLHYHTVLLALATVLVAWCLAVLSWQVERRVNALNHPLIPDGQISR